MRYDLGGALSELSKDSGYAKLMLEEAFEAAAAGKTYFDINTTRLFAADLIYIDEWPHVRIGQLPRDVTPAILEVVKLLRKFGFEVTQPIVWSSPIRLRRVED